MPIDLRSDTVTRPTPEMREAMRTAEVGNAAWGEDPTVRRLEESSAAAVGHEAALFVPSGTMGNQAALLAWCAGHQAPEVILEERSHIQVYESGGLARLAGAQGRTIRGEGGAMPVEEVESAIVGGDAEEMRPRTALVCLEDTHNLAGGVPLPLAHLDAIHALAQEHGLPVHLDGARIFNAAVAQGVPASRIGKEAESVMFCFSKGLGAPIGSVLCGATSFIERAERARLLLGGAMRQAGVVAAAAQVSLETGLARLADDHANARRLAEGLAKLEGLAVEVPETNLVYFEVGSLGLDAARFCAALAGQDVLYDAVGGNTVRAVTHRDVTRDDITRALEVTAAALTPS